MKYINRLKDRRRCQLLQAELDAKEIIKKKFLKEIDPELLAEIKDYVVFGSYCVKITLPNHAPIIWYASNYLGVEAKYYPCTCLNIVDALIAAEKYYEK